MPPLTAGPEVKYFALLKRGDQVIMQYYSGFAIAIKQEGSGLEAKTSTIQVDIATPGEKPGMKMTSRTHVSVLGGKPFKAKPV